MKPYPVLEVANELLRYAANNDAQELMSNTKLQKMLYYEQGFHLAYFNKPLFSEAIEAWMYGPVVPVVYEKYGKNGKNGIEPDPDIVLQFSSSKEDALFREVCKVYGAYSASGLMDKTHREAPWKTTPTGSGNVISQDKMARFFKTRLR